MGILDDVSSAIGRGTSAAERKAREVKLNSQMNDVNKRRQGFAAQLGASLYEATKDDPSFREGRETLYDNIAACDDERAKIQNDLAALKAEAEASSAAAHSFACAVCGARVTEADLYCSGCGTPVAQARPVQQPVATPAASAASRCPNCNEPISPGDAFCMHCGTKIEAPAEAPAPTSEPVPVPVPEPTSEPVQIPEPEPESEPVAMPDTAPESNPVPVPEPEPTIESEPVAQAPVCSKCGSPLGPEDRLCANCGTKVE